MNGPLKWHGGKHYLAAKIVTLMPPHLHYVEPYAGGLAVLLERDPNDKRFWIAQDGQRGGVSEVANDIHGELMNFWRTLQGQTSFNQFSRLVNAIPLGREGFEEASRNSILAADGYGESVHRAATFFIRCRQSRAGTFKGFTSLSRSRTRRGINGNASEWLGAVEGLPEVHARLRPVVLENMDALQLIRREDGKDTLFYCDPPYCACTRITKDAYAHEMSESQHGELLCTLSNIKGKFLLSGYRSELYDKTAREQHWWRLDIEIANHAAGGASKRRMTESLWTNYELAFGRRCDD